MHTNHDHANATERSPVTEAKKSSLMDATPMRIKRRNIGGLVSEVRVFEPSSSEQAQEEIRRLHTDGESFTVIGAQSNVVGALETGARTAVSTRRLDDVLEFDPVSQLVTVGAGTMGGNLERWLNDRGFTLGQFPQSLHISTVGGWVNTRASGAISARNGGIENAVKGATVILADGERLHFPPRARPAGGMDGLSVFLGSEGSLGVVTDVTLEVRRSLPEAHACLLFDGLEAVINAQRELIQSGYPVALLRGYNAAETNHVLGEDADGHCLLMLSTIGPEDCVEAQLGSMRAHLARQGGTDLPADAADRWYAERFQVNTMMEDRNAKSGQAFDTIEVSVPWRSAAACATEMERVMAEHSDPFYLHFSHAYQTGVCFYSLLWLQAANDTEVLAQMQAAWKAALDIVTSHDGQIGHHHGIGGVRSSRYAGTADALIHRRVKKALDPAETLLAKLLKA